MKRIYIQILRELNVLDEVSLKPGEKNLKNFVLNFFLALVYTGLIKIGEWLVYLFVFCPILAFDLEPFIYYNVIITIVETMFWVLNISKASYLQFLIGFWVGIFKGYFYLLCIFELLQVLIAIGVDYRTFIPQNILNIAFFAVFYASIVLTGFRTGIGTIKSIEKQ